MTDTPDHIHQAAMRFCSACAATLTSRYIANRQRPFCDHCVTVTYFDPKLAAGAIVVKECLIALIKRSISPAFGKWTFPGGYVDRGAPVDRAAVRETWEETGLRIRLEGLHGVFSYSEVTVVLIVYTATVTGGILAAGDECDQAVWTKPADIPWEDLAFPSTTDALRIWINQEGQ